MSMSRIENHPLSVPDIFRHTAFNRKKTTTFKGSLRLRCLSIKTKNYDHEKKHVIFSSRTFYLFAFHSFKSCASKCNCIEEMSQVGTSPSIAYPEMEKQLLEKQKAWEVDATTGATYSLYRFRYAVTLAIIKAQMAN